MNLKQINNQMKSYINEASFIGNKCRNKLIELVNKNFLVKIPKENFLNIDITIKENGNIIYRDTEYKTEVEVTTEEQLQERYESFKEEVEILLKKKEVNFKTKRQNNEIVNLLVTILITLIIILVIYFSIKELLSGNLIGFIWIIIMIIYYIIPSLGSNLKNRYKQAYKFIKRLFK